MNKPNYRREIGKELFYYFQRDKELCLLVCDMGFGVIEEIRRNFPQRVINTGIMEQATVGISAGLAMAGLKPVVYSIVNFLVFRALEQIRNDVVLQGLEVKFIATGVNNYFSFLGASHCCGEDDKIIMELIGMKVFDPYRERKPFSKVVREWIDYKGCAYIRV